MFARKYRVTRTSLELLHLSRGWISSTPPSVDSSLDDEELAIGDNDRDKNENDDDDDDEDLGSEMFEQGRSGSSDRSTEFELDLRERLRNI